MVRYVKHVLFSKYDIVTTINNFKKKRRHPVRVIYDELFSQNNKSTTSNSSTKKTNDATKAKGQSTLPQLFKNKAPLIKK